MSAVRAALWLAVALATAWFILACAEPTARDAASNAYTRLYVEMSRRATTVDDDACLDAIEAAWRRSWDGQRAEDFAMWALTDGWCDLPACERATFGGAL